MWAGRDGPENMARARATAIGQGKNGGECRYAGIVARAYRWDRFVISLFQQSRETDGGWGFTVAYYGTMVRVGWHESDHEAWRLASGADLTWTMEQADAAARAAAQLAVQVQEEALLETLVAGDERRKDAAGTDGLNRPDEPGLPLDNPRDSLRVLSLP
jgi:hypothetical protein